MTRAVESVPTVPAAATAAAGGAEHIRTDLRIIGAVRRILRTVYTYSRQLERQRGVTFTQLTCLAELRDHGQLTLRGLADRVRMSPSTLVAVVDRLVAASYVDRDRDPHDRRKLVLRLTVGGEQLLDESPALLDDVLAARLNALPEAERQVAAHALEQLAGLLPANVTAADGGETVSPPDGALESST